MWLQLSAEKLMEAEGSLLSVQEALFFLQDPFKDEKIEYTHSGSL
jgi:hypothetical protein